MNQDFVDRLADQAGIQFNKRRALDDTDPLGYMESDVDFVLNNLDAVVELIEQGGLEKFAELIVRDCVAIVDALDSIRVESFHRADGSKVITSNVLKQHFGVK